MLYYYYIGKKAEVNNHRTCITWKYQGREIMRCFSVPFFWIWNRRFLSCRCIAWLWTVHSSQCLDRNPGWYGRGRSIHIGYTWAAVPSPLATVQQVRRLSMPRPSWHTWSTCNPWILRHVSCREYRCWPLLWSLWRSCCSCLNVSLLHCYPLPWTLWFT